MKKVKLIRDKLRPDSNNPHVAVYSAIGDQPSGPYPWEEAAYAALLINKLHEEVGEVAQDMEDPSEYADVLEVLQRLAAINGVDWDEVIACQQNKKSHRGGFQRGKFMVRS